MGGGSSAPAPKQGKPLKAEELQAAMDPLKRLKDMNAKFASFKDTAAIEAFLKLAYKKANREEALINILTNDHARTHFAKFLEKEFYAGKRAEYEVPH
jgi:hypothetical protein